MTFPLPHPWLPDQTADPNSAQHRAQSNLEAIAKDLGRHAPDRVWINVKNWGAKGDGVTDDSAAVNEAITDLGSRGGVVFFPPGPYVLNSTVAWAKDNVHLVGSGRIATKIMMPAASIGIDIGDGVTQYHYFSLSKLTLTRSVAGGATAVRIRKGDQFRFDDCDIAAGTNCLELSECIAGVVSASGINSATDTSILMDNSDQMVFQGNTFESNFGALRHIYLASGNKAITVTGNAFSTAVRAVYADGGQSTDCSIVGNTVENCTHGFQLAPVGSGLARSSIVGNTLRGIGAASSFGIYLCGSDNVVVGNAVTNYTESIAEVGAGVGTNLVFGNRVTVDPTVTTGSSFDGGNLRDGVRFGSTTAQKQAFWGATPTTRPTVTGSRGGNAALASLLTQLATVGLITDSTTA